MFSLYLEELSSFAAKSSKNEFLVLFRSHWQSFVECTASDRGSRVNVCLGGLWRGGCGARFNYCVTLKWSEQMRREVCTSLRDRKASPSNNETKVLMKKSWKWFNCYVIYEVTSIAAPLSPPFFKLNAFATNWQHGTESVFWLRKGGRKKNISSHSIECAWEKKEGKALGIFSWLRSINYTLAECFRSSDSLDFY